MMEKKNKIQERCPKVILNKSLEILLKNVKSVEDLDLINRAITDYEREFHYDFKKYRKMLIKLKNGY